MKSIHLLSIIIKCVEFSLGLPWGAPDSACSQMVPGHANSPNLPPSPYVIHIQGDKTYTPGKSIYVKVIGEFRGILLQARKTDGSTVPVGSFSAPPWGLKLKTCVSANDSVTHSNAFLNQLANVTLIWHPPAYGTGEVAIIATIAAAKHEWWTDNLSQSLLPASMIPDEGAAVKSQVSSSAAAPTMSIHGRDTGDEPITVLSDDLDIPLTNDTTHNSGNITGLGEPLTVLSGDRDITLTNDTTLNITGLVLDIGNETVTDPADGDIFSNVTVFNTTTVLDVGDATETGTNPAGGDIFANVTVFNTTTVLDVGDANETGTNPAGGSIFANVTVFNTTTDGDIFPNVTVFNTTTEGVKSDGEKRGKVKKKSKQTTKTKQKKNKAK